MRKMILFCMILMVPASIFAQDAFEGVIKFKTDVKGQNPVMTGMMPDSFIFLFSGKDSKIIMHGGIVSAMMGDIICKGDSNVSFMLDIPDKIAYRYDKEKYEKSSTVDIEETGKTKKILDKNCSLYRISYDSKDGYVVTDIWMTEEIPVIMPRNNPMGKYFTYPELKGIPLSIESKIEYQSTKFDIIITAVKIIERPIPAFEFFIPEGYKIVPLSSTPDAGF